MQDMPATIAVNLFSVCDPNVVDLVNQNQYRSFVAPWSPSASNAEEEIEKKVQGLFIDDIKGHINHHLPLVRLNVKVSKGSKVKDPRSFFFTISSTLNICSG